MNVINVKVSAGRTYPHPNEAFSNLRSDVTLEAVLDDLDGTVEASVRKLQAAAEKLVEDHKRDQVLKIKRHDLEQQIAWIERQTPDAEFLNQLRHELNQLQPEPEENQDIVHPVHEVHTVHKVHKPPFEGSYWAANPGRWVHGKSIVLTSLKPTLSRTDVYTLTAMHGVLAHAVMESTDIEPLLETIVTKAMNVADKLNRNVADKPNSTPRDEQETTE